MSSFVEFKNVWLAYNDELFAQGLAPRRVDATEVFSEMERVAGE